MNWKRFPLIALCFAFALAALAALRAQETPPAPPAEPAKPAAAEVAAPTPAEPAVAPAEAEPAQEEVKAAADEEPMRELAPADPAPEKPAKKKRARSGQGEAPPFGDHLVPAGQKWAEAVSIMGSTTVEGEVADVAVSVMGNTTVGPKGSVGDAAVSVMGTTTVNGHVRGEVVAVLGDVVLGPDAVVDGEIVCVLGKVVRDSSSVVHGGVQQIGPFGPAVGFDWLHAYVYKCVFLGRPLAFGANLGWAWGIAGIFLVFYVLLALIFPRGIDRCVEALEQKPGNSILAALLTALLAPVAIVLLAVTGFGLVLIPFVVAGLFFCTLFGKAAVFAWFGRRVTNLLGEGPWSHAAFAVLLGGLMVTVLYTIPVLGILLWKLFGILGLGMVVYVLINSMKREKPAAPVAVPMGAAAAAASASAAPAASGMATSAFAAPVAFAPAQSAGFGDASIPAATVPPIEPPLASPVAGSPFTTPVGGPPTLSAMTLPRAGFWIRVAAAFLDFMLIGIGLVILGNIVNFDGPGLMFFGLAAYSATMWKLKGTTVGGVICGLKVVRLDDRPIDWGVAIVRALSAFLSFFVVFLGFIWVAFDDEKQSWHDKIAGTTIVRMPKGTPLI